jgi:hypothetical protein
VYNQLLGIKLRTVSLWVALVYLDTESLWQRNRSYTQTLVASLKNTKKHNLYDKTRQTCFNTD